MFLSRYVGGLFSRLVSTQNTRQEMSAELGRIRMTIAVKGRGNLGNHDKKGTQSKHGKTKSVSASCRRVGGWTNSPIHS